MMRSLLIGAYARIRALLASEDGANLVEYALIIALAVSAIFAGLQAFAIEFGELVTYISESITPVLDS